MATFIFLAGSMLGFGGGLAAWMGGHMTLVSAFGFYVAVSLTISLLSVAYAVFVPSFGRELSDGGL